MPFGAIIRPGVIRPFSLIRISPISWACYHKVPSNSTNGSLPIYVAPSFPDDFESSPLASEGAKIGKEIPKWDESQATFSEAAVFTSLPINPNH